MRQYLIPSILALAVATTAVLHGCGTGTGTVFHETSSLYLKNVNPPMNLPSVTGAGTDESLLFSETLITIGNLSAIPVTLSRYKVDYTEIRNGLSVPSLSLSGRVSTIIPGVTGFPYSEPRLPDSGSGSGSTTSSSTTSTSGGSSSTSSTSSSTSGASAAEGIVSLQLWSPAVRKYAFLDFKGGVFPEDLRDLQANITFYGTDFNGNSITVQAVTDLIATLQGAAKK